MIALTVIESWAVVGIAVAGVILTWKVLDLAVEQGRQWLDAAPEGEDESTNRERER